MRRYGFRTAGFRNSRLEAALEAIAQAGYTCVELCLECHGLVDLAPEPLRKSLAEVQKRGLTVCSFSYHGDDQAPDERWRNIERSLELAIACDVPVLILNGDRLGEDPPEATLTQFIKRLKGLTPDAAAAGVRLAVEPEPGLSVRNTADMLRVLEDLPAPPVAVNLDVGHAFLTDDMLKTFQVLGPHIVHMHIEDMQHGVHRHLLPGDGDVNFGQVQMLAAAVDYNGPWVIDLFHADADPFEYCRVALERLQQVLSGAD